MSTTKQNIQKSGANGAPAERVSAAFTLARKENRALLIPYFMCGYPSAQRSAEIILAAAQAGADLIELGMPFSDPLADGASIQQAGHFARARGMTIQGCLEVAALVSARSTAPLLLMGYYNPILAYGTEDFCRAAAESGVCGLIIPDLPVEEAGPLQQAALAHGLTMIFLIPPTTPDKRAASIIQQASGIPGSFIYCVSLSGVTGSRAVLLEHLPAFISRIYRLTQVYNLPIVIGFGLSTPEHVNAVAHLADGAAVGSALVRLIDKHDGDAQAEAVRRYIGELRAAVVR